jgi:hypothetical protein
MVDGMLTVKANIGKLSLGLSVEEFNSECEDLSDDFLDL